MTKIYIVAGTTITGGMLFGLYPTEALAKARVAQLEKLFADGIDWADVYWDIVEVGAEGGDCNVMVGN